MTDIKLHWPMSISSADTQETAIAAPMNRIRDTTRIRPHDQHAERLVDPDIHATHDDQLPGVGKPGM